MRVTKQNSVFVCLAGSGPYDSMIHPAFDAQTLDFPGYPNTLSPKSSSSSQSKPSSWLCLWLPPRSNFLDIPTFPTASKNSFGQMIPNLYLQSYSPPKLKPLGILMWPDLSTLNHKCPKQIITFTYTWSSFQTMVLRLSSLQCLNPKSQLWLLPWPPPLHSTDK